MSRYPMPYQSSSRGPVQIEDMHTAHLENAAKKVAGQPTPHPVLHHLHAELGSRGAIFSPDGSWTWPPKQEVAP